MPSTSGPPHSSATRLRGCSSGGISEFCTSKKTANGRRSTILPGNLMNRLSFLKQRHVKVAVVLLLLAGSVALWLGRSKPQAGATTFVARRGPLQINLLEGGSIEARQAQEVRSEVKGGTKILSIVEEGYFVTEED